RWPPTQVSIWFTVDAQIPCSCESIAADRLDWLIRNDTILIASVISTMSATVGTSIRFFRFHFIKCSGRREFAGRPTRRGVIGSQFASYTALKIPKIPFHG